MKFGTKRKKMGEAKVAAAVTATASTARLKEREYM